MFTHTRYSDKVITFALLLLKEGWTWMLLHILPQVGTFRLNQESVVWCCSSECYAALQGHCMLTVLAWEKIFCWINKFWLDFCHLSLQSLSRQSSTFWYRIPATLHRTVQKHPNPKTFDDKVAPVPEKKEKEEEKSHPYCKLPASVRASLSQT